MISVCHDRDNGTRRVRIAKSHTQAGWLCSLVLLLAQTVSVEAAEVIPSQHRQLVLVVTDSWEAKTGRLQRFERIASDIWQPVGNVEPVVVGRTGLAWGRGLHQVMPDGEPVKHEGDGRAPAGVFRLSSIFGYEEAPNNKLSMPYIAAGTATECIDDPESRHYNQIIDTRKTPGRDWKSSEQMRRKDELYRWGVVVDHNPLTSVKFLGSCVFLHIWRSATSPTVGCTALAPASMKQLAYWLNESHEPVLVQLPQPVLNRVGGAWKLPSFTQ